MSQNKSVKVGVIGVGHLGKFHIEQYLNVARAEVVGIFDTDSTIAKNVSQEYNIKSFDTLDKLLQSCDAVSIVTPTINHYSVSYTALDYGCHTFIEKPITQTVDQARNLLEKADQENKLIQVGHIEQFNPAFLSLKLAKINPRFIESHRLSPFNLRGTDVPVVLDLMIHDIGIVLELVQSKIQSIEANGVKVVSDTVDIANARLKFKNGCVANMTASRISQKKMRKLRFFQENNYTTIDFIQNIVEMYEVSDIELVPSDNEKCFSLESDPPKFVIYRKPEIKPRNALRLELEHFVESILHNNKPIVDGYHATEALSISIIIQNIIDQ